MSAYYNEIDPFAAQWLRNLISAGHIAPGEVDTRSIEEVQADDLRGFTQCHFFAGIGVWSHALRLAGWADDRPVWTGSCPCQPFSAAGRGYGFDDERHLWPVWQRLIAECRPPAILGEQVASKAVDPWVELVQADLEALGYAVGAVPIPAAGVGAPHIRDRLWWVADAERGRQDADQHAGSGHPPSSVGQAGERGSGRATRLLADADDAGSQGRREPGCERALERLAGPGGVAGGLADAASAGLLPGPHGGIHRGQEGAGPRDAEPERPRSVDGVGDPRSATGQRDAGSISAPEAGEHGPGQSVDGRLLVGPEHASAGNGQPRPTDGFWRDADWLLCRDGKWRPVEPGTFPLAHGASARVGRLRAYGNAIVPQVAAEFIAAFAECPMGLYVNRDFPPTQKVTQ